MATKTKDRLAVPLRCSGYPESNPLVGTDRICIIDDTGDTIACMCPAEQAREMAHRCNLYDELVTGIERLASMACFDTPRVIDKHKDRELLARINFACTLLAKA